ncbi:MAG: DUF3501 family protein [Gemmataceae bacterium]|nr:DUF3501 family protein [Gemmataceae bacterium]
MQPLTLDDLMSLDEYTSRRGEFFEALQQYLNRYRRVRIGPRLTLVFENRQTLWFHVQEIARVARLADPRRLTEELQVYNRLLPGPDQLQAALLIEIEDERRLGEELRPWQDLRGEYLGLHAGEVHVPGTLVTCRPEDRCTGTAHWVKFVFDTAARAQFADLRQPAYFTATLPSYAHQGPPLSDEVRQSLLDDLALSDRRAA